MKNRGNELLNLLSNFLLLSSCKQIVCALLKFYEKDQSHLNHQIRECQPGSEPAKTESPTAKYRAAGSRARSKNKVKKKVKKA